MFGPEDGFFNRFASLARMLPVLPLIGGGETKFQPAFVGDVAEAIARAVDGAVAGGRIYEFGGPEVKSFRELVAYICEVTGRKRSAGLAAIPAGAAAGAHHGDRRHADARAAAERAEADPRSGHAAGKRQCRLPGGEGGGPRFRWPWHRAELVEAVVPSYLWRFRKAGQFDAARAG
jgi:uncharacterized protein YbjT (DUF2867 family)